MEYANIRKIEVFTEPTVVNEYLALGWQLLNIYVTTTETQSSYSNQTANYVLGWPFSFLDDGPVYPKNTTKSE